VEASCLFLLTGMKDFIERDEEEGKLKQAFNSGERGPFIRGLRVRKEGEYSGRVLQGDPFPMYFRIKSEFVVSLFNISYVRSYRNIRNNEKSGECGTCLREAITQESLDCYLYQKTSARGKAGCRAGGKCRF